MLMGEKVQDENPNGVANEELMGWWADFMGYSLMKMSTIKHYYCNFFQTLKILNAWIIKENGGILLNNL